MNISHFGTIFFNIWRMSHFLAALPVLRNPFFEWPRRAETWWMYQAISLFLLFLTNVSAFGHLSGKNKNKNKNKNMNKNKNKNKNKNNN